MKNCIVAQSGGPTVAINASLSGGDSKKHIPVALTIIFTDPCMAFLAS